MSNNTEGQLNHENLEQIIITGAVENYSAKRGRLRSTEDLDGLIEGILFKEPSLRQEYSLQPNSLTKMIVVPLSGINAEITRWLKDVKPNEQSAVYLNYPTIKTDHFGRSGLLDCVAIMTNQDASRFLEAVKKIRPWPSS